jgi:uncharacterized membrane protein YhaH (DUF805 family)
VPATPEATELPPTLRWAVWLLWAEAVGLAALTAYLVYESLTATANDRSSALFVTLFAAVGAVILVLLGRALARRRPAARAPAIVLELMLLPVGYYMTQGGMGWLGIPLIALGLLVCGLLLSPPSTKALGVG